MEARRWVLRVGFLMLAISVASWPVATDSAASVVRAPPGTASATSPDGPSSPPASSSSSLALTADGGTLLVVNPDSNSLTFVDTTTLVPVFELEVGSDPRTVAVSYDGTRAYVANRGGGSVSAIDLAARQVITTVAVGHRPYGVVVSPDGGWLYVAEQGMDRLSVLDTVTWEKLASYPVDDRPSGLALTGDGQTLFVTHLLGNRMTVFDAPSVVVYLPLVLRPWSKSMEASARQGAFGPPSSTTLDKPRVSDKRDREAAERGITLISSAVPLWPDSNLIQAVVLGPCPPGDGGPSSMECAYVPHTQSLSSNPNLTFETTVRPQVSIVDVASREHLIGQHFDLSGIDPPAVGLPFDAAVTSGGGELWVVNAASNDLTVVDLEMRQRAAHVEVGANPRAIALAEDGAVAYVNNTLDGTVSVIDTGAYTVTNVITVTDIPLPPLLLRGKQLFHTSADPRLARDQWISCNTCHFEGEHDGRTWTFGFAGPRNTTSLLGMIETYPLRWSGEWDESADSEFANRKENFGSGLVDGDMNCSLSPADCVNHPPNQGRSYDLDALAAFMDSLQVEMSPSHARGEPLSLAELRGKAIFEDPAVGCATCHPAPLYTDLQLHDVGTSTPDERIGPAFDTPTLRGLYDSAPYFHDGSADTLLETVTRPSPGSEHDVRGLLNEEERADLMAFLVALPYQQ